MRRADREVTDKDRMLQIIEACDVCRLAIADEDVPYILPVNFGSEVIDGVVHLYVHGATEGRKYDVMAAAGKASFEMDWGHELQCDPDRGYCTMTFESVIGWGELHEVEGDEAKAHTLQVLCDHYHLGDDFVYSPAAIYRTRVFDLVVQDMTAKVKG